MEQTAYFRERMSLVVVIRKVLKTWIVLLLAAGGARGATLYVDHRLINDCPGTYSIAGFPTCDGAIALLALFPSLLSAGIADRYVADAGIEGDPAVLFVETFDDASLPGLRTRWTERRNEDMLSFSTDLPPGSASGGRSLRITSIGGTNGGGHVYKRLASGVDDRLYLRYYVKYEADATFHHSGGGMGGYNPPTPWAQGHAGERPAGDDRFTVGAEYVSAAGSIDSANFDYYTYWMHMRGNPGDDRHWGNTFINDPAVVIPRGQWTCVELMIKMNDPVGSFNGEMALWIDGNQVSHLGSGFPLGRWLWDRFIPGAEGTPFEGFQWRTDPAVNLNWIRLAHYVSQEPAGRVRGLWFDHVVLATDYIGPLGNGSSLAATARPRRLRTRP